MHIGAVGRRASLKLTASLSTLALSLSAASAQSAALLPIAPASSPAPAQDGSAPRQDGTKKTTGSADAVGTSTATTVEPGEAAPQAGEDDAAPSASGRSEDIVVTGVRQSLSSAQAIKRSADTVVDAITADDVGALPDRSVNEALQRVPGVAISRFAAPNDSQHFSVEGSGVVVRGLSYVRSEFNGRDTFAVSGGRQIGFNDVPSELVGSISVFKNLTADLIEGGISGTVDISTRKPFDQNKRLVYLTGSVNYGDMERRGAPSAVGVFSNQWALGDGSRIGALVSASYSQQYSRSDSVFLKSMLPRYNDDRNGNGVQDAGEGRVINAGTEYESTLFDTFPLPAGFNQVYVPVGGGVRSQTFGRDRTGLSAALQYENADRTVLVTGQYLRTQSHQDWLEHTIEPTVYYGDVTTTFPAAGIQNTYDENGVFTSGSVVKRNGSRTGIIPGRVCGTPARPSVNCPLTQFAPNGLLVNMTNRYFDTDTMTEDYSLNVKVSPTERLHLNFDGQYVNSNAQKIDDSLGFSTYAGVNLDLRGKVPQITFAPEGRDANAYFASKASSFFSSMQNGRDDSDGHEWAFRADGRFDVGRTGLQSVRAGFRYAKRDQTVRTNDYNNFATLSGLTTSGGVISLDRLPPEAAMLYTYPDFFRGQAGQPPSAWYVSDAIMRDHDALTALLRQVNRLGGGSYVPLEDRSDLVDGLFRSSEYYRNSEETWAGYARVDFGVDGFAGMKLSGNAGVRYVRTVGRSFGAFTFPQRNQVLPLQYATVAAYCADVAVDVRSPLCLLSPAQQQAALAFSNGASVPSTVEQRYGHWLPSLNLRLDATSKLLFRLAASRAISRPDFGDLRAFIGVLPVAGDEFSFRARARNPYLRPIEATQVDLTAEWYFAKVGSVTFAAFYKDLTNIILSNYGYDAPFTNNGQTFTVTVNGPANAPGHGRIKGVELAYQQTYDFLPGVLSGFGTQATFTYVDPGNIPNGVPANGAANGSRPPLDVTGLYAALPLQGLSRYNFNVAAFYEKFGLTARLAYSWRSKFLLTNRDCCFPYLPVYSLASGQLDGSVFFAVNSQFRIGVQAQNLLDTTTRTVFALDAKGLTAPRSSFKSDRQISLTTRIRF